MPRLVYTVPAEYRDLNNATIIRMKRLARTEARTHANHPSAAIPPSRPVDPRTGPAFTIQGLPSERETRSEACTCERSEHAVTLMRALEFNARREVGGVDSDTGRAWAGQERWEVPLWVVKAALRAERECKAVVHFPAALATAWYGNDVETSTEKEAQTTIEAERHLNSSSTADLVTARWGFEYDRYAEQEAFVNGLIAERRNQLVRLIQALGGDPAADETVAWVKGRIAAKHGNRLRGYCSCIGSLRNRIEREQGVAA